MKTKIRDVSPTAALFRDTKTGLAWVENCSAGIAHSAHPNISASGSVRGMVSRGYWKREDRKVRVRGFVYNVSRVVSSDPLDEIARAECRCGGAH